MVRLILRKSDTSEVNLDGAKHGMGNVDMNVEKRDNSLKATKAFQGQAAR